MNLKKVVIALNTKEVQEILRIDLDEDASEALAFIKEKLAKQVKGRCNPIECPFSRPVTAPGTLDSYSDDRGQPKS